MSHTIHDVGKGKEWGVGERYVCILFEVRKVGSAGCGWFVVFVVCRLAWLLALDFACMR
jgi:hypothetical protein